MREIVNYLADISISNLSLCFKGVVVWVCDERVLLVYYAVCLLPDVSMFYRYPLFFCGAHSMLCVNVLQISFIFWWRQLYAMNLTFPDLHAYGNVF